MAESVTFSIVAFGIIHGLMGLGFLLFGSIGLSETYEKHDGKIPDHAYTAFEWYLTFSVLQFACCGFAFLKDPRQKNIADALPLSPRKYAIALLYRSGLFLYVFGCIVILVVVFVRFLYAHKFGGEIWEMAYGHAKVKQQVRIADNLQGHAFPTMQEVPNFLAFVVPWLNAFSGALALCYVPHFRASVLHCCSCCPTRVPVTEGEQDFFADDIQTAMLAKNDEDDAMLNEDVFFAQTSANIAIDDAAHDELPQEHVTEYTQTKLGSGQKVVLVVFEVFAALNLLAPTVNFALRMREFENPNQFAALYASHNLAEWCCGLLFAAFLGNLITYAAILRQAAENRGGNKDGAVSYGGEQEITPADVEEPLVGGEDIEGRKKAQSKKAASPDDEQPWKRRAESETTRDVLLLECGALLTEDGRLLPRTTKSSIFFKAWRLVIGSLFVVLAGLYVWKFVETWEWDAKPVLVGRPATSSTNSNSAGGPKQWYKKDQSSEGRTGKWMLKRAF
ncbi:unnamed protein product [Amoebophrya sp. A25]|nr:unnamed protein product [Amoebophrya sp. A25]|eukprot:GSA25T00015548001.1